MKKTPCIIDILSQLANPYSSWLYLKIKGILSPLKSTACVQWDLDGCVNMPATSIQAHRHTFEK